MPRAVVTGGAGFVGSHLCEALRARGWEDERIDGILSRNLLRFLRESLPSL